MDGKLTFQDFGAFVGQREALNRQLEESRLAIDSWLAQQAFPPSMPALAHLELMLKQRREQLEALVALDDDFMTYLIGMRGQELGEGLPRQASSK